MFNQILCGNHLDILPCFPDDTFDMFLTSPPYDNLRTYEGYDFQFEPLARELYRILKPGGVGVWIVNDATIDGSETLTSAKQKIFFREVCGFNIHDTMIYNRFSPFPQEKRYWQSFEFMFILAKGKPLTFNPLKERRNFESQKRLKGSRSKAISFRQKDGKLIQCNEKAMYRLTHQDSTTRIKSNIWYCPAGFCSMTLDKFAHGHPALFPEKLAEDHILSWSNPGDVILDPMCGSGTTCKMAAKHGRQYVGIDIAEKYCEIARKRVALIEAQPILFNGNVGEQTNEADLKEMQGETGGLLHTVKSANQVDCWNL